MPNLLKKYFFVFIVLTLTFVTCFFVFPYSAFSTLAIIICGLCMLVVGFCGYVYFFRRKKKKDKDFIFPLTSAAILIFFITIFVASYNP